MKFAFYSSEGETLKAGGTERPEVPFGRGSDAVASALAELAGVTGKAVYPPRCARDRVGLPAARMSITDPSGSFLQPPYEQDAACQDADETAGSESRDAHSGAGRPVRARRRTRNTVFFQDDSGQNPGLVRLRT